MSNMQKIYPVINSIYNRAFIKISSTALFIHSSFQLSGLPEPDIQQFRYFITICKRYCFGFRMLTLGWSGGSTFLPVNNILLSSKKAGNRVNEAAALEKKQLDISAGHCSCRKGHTLCLNFWMLLRKLLFRQSNY